MKKLLNTFYVTTPDTYLALDGENIVVQSGGEELRRVPLHNLENIVSFGYQGASPALMRHAAELGIGVAFFSNSGRFLCRVEGERRGNVLLRREQYRIADDEKRKLSIAINIIGAKMMNSRTVLLRALRDHPMLQGAEEVRRCADSILDSAKAIRNVENLDTLRGIEGECAARYFSIFDNLILQNKTEFKFAGRNRRPPTDKVNALLSFCYAIMANECASALEGVGLDPYVGFMHADRPGRRSLALDIMEELRSVFCDRFVVTIINLRQITAESFELKENGAILLTDDARKTLLIAWQKKKQEIITHPFLEEKCQWGIVPHLQAQLLARFIRGDIDDYPPFLWR